MPSLRNGCAPLLSKIDFGKGLNHFRAHPELVEGSPEPVEGDSASGPSILKEAGVSAAEIDAFERIARDEIEAALAAAETADWPEGEAAYLDVQDIGAACRGGVHG